MRIAKRCKSGFSINVDYADEVEYEEKLTMRIAKRCKSGFSINVDYADEVWKYSLEQETNL